MTYYDQKGFQLVKLEDSSENDDDHDQFMKVKRVYSYKKIFCFGLVLVTLLFFAYLVGILLFYTIGIDSHIHNSNETVSTQQLPLPSPSTSIINSKIVTSSIPVTASNIPVNTTSALVHTKINDIILSATPLTKTYETSEVLPSEQTIEWSTTFLPATSELTPVTIDINHDGMPDLLVTQALPNLEEGKYTICPGKENKCLPAFGYTPCRMKLLALDGSNGSIIWQVRLDIIPFAVNCKHDMTNDGRNDCVLSGRDGSLALIDMREGSIIWVVDPIANFPPYSFYYPYIGHDFDNDGALDLIIAHGGDQKYDKTDVFRSPGLIMVISGQTGQLLSERIVMPDGHETYSNPILYKISGTIEVVLFGSGGETLPGSLWAITIQSLQEHVSRRLRDIRSTTNDYTINKQFIDAQCYTDEDKMEEQRPFFEEQFVNDRWDKWMMDCPRWSDNVAPIWNIYNLCVYEFVASGETGTMMPPVVIDHNKDGVMDVLVPQFNDHVILIDGATSTVVWDNDVKDTQMYRSAIRIYALICVNAINRIPAAYAL